MSMDKMPGAEATEAEIKQALFIYRKITCLRSLPCCGMCGTFRYATKPFWCLGMRLCRHCVQANLVSSLVLYEKFWVTFKQPVQSHRSFVDAVCMNVFFFSTRVTPLQRMEFSCDRLDFPGGTRTVWFFWKPHLAKVLDMAKLEREGRKKHAAASVVRAHARRALILRALRGNKDRRAPTLLPTNVFTKREFFLRGIEFRIRRTELLDKVDAWFEQRMTTQLNQGLYGRLLLAEDRVVPFMYN
jgi:hypothetical protein